MILGYDTETSLGQLRLITNSNGEYLYFEQNKYGLKEVEQVIEWLYQSALSAEYNVFYNINFDFGVIMKPFFVEHEQELHDLHFSQIRKAHEAVEEGREESVKDDELFLRFKIGKYTVKLISHKSFSIKKSRKSVYFFDAANFYMSSDDVHLSLDTAGKRYLGKEKNEWGNNNRRRMGEDPDFFTNHLDEIKQYCIDDCMLTRDLFAKTIESYRNIGLNFPVKPYSKASIFKQYLKDNDIMSASQEHYNALASVPAFKIIKASYHGAINQVFGVGLFEQVTDVDINSAYSTAMSNLVDISNARMVEYGDSAFNNADYKFYNITTTATHLLGVKHYNSWIYPVSKTPVEYNITEWDKKILDEHGCDYTINYGIGLVCAQKKKPFSFIHNFFNVKSEVKKKYGSNSVEYANIKIFLNAGYGVLAEHKRAETQFTNYIYASYITAQTRYTIRHIQKEVVDSGRQPISISTDGICYTGMQIHENSIELGKLTVAQVKRYVNFGSGVYIKDKTIKKRGYYELNLEAIDIPAPSYTIRIRPKPVPIVTAIIQKRTKDIGLFKSEEKVFCPYLMLMKAGTNEELPAWTISDFFRDHLFLSPYRYEDLNLEHVAKV